MSYAIVQPEGQKAPLLLKILKPGLGVVPDGSKWTDPKRHEFRGKDVIIPLGEKPPYGVAYGVTVEPVMNRKLVKGWGEIHWYIDADDTLESRIHKAFRISLSRLKSRGLDGWHPVITEVRHPKGKVNATYHYKPKGQDKIILRPAHGQGMREFVKVISHEAGHGVWHRQMAPEDRAAWIELYEEYVSVKTVTPDDVKNMVRGMRQVEGIRPYLKEIEPADQAAVNIYLGWLKKVHGISAREVQDLIAAGRKIPRPDTHLHRSDVDTPITLYSRTSPPELFCEALGSDIVGDLSDKRIRKMLRNLER